MKIKVCGNTILSQVKELDDLGIDYAGFIFYKRSPRFMGEKIDKKEIQNLSTKLKKVVMHLAKQNRDDLNSDATKPILEQKSMIAGQVSVLLKELGGDTTANLKDLQ